MRAEHQQAALRVGGSGREAGRGAGVASAEHLFG